MTHFTSISPIYNVALEFKQVPRQALDHEKTDVIPIMIIQKVWSVNFKPVTTQYQLSCPLERTQLFLTGPFTACFHKVYLMSVQGKPVFVCMIGLVQIYKSKQHLKV